MRPAAGELPGVQVVEGDAITSDANERAVTVAVDSLRRSRHPGQLRRSVRLLQGRRGPRRRRPFQPRSTKCSGPTCSATCSRSKPRSRLRTANGPSIVLTESTSSYYPGRGGVLYVSSKFAVRGLVTALAHELAPQIRVNGVAPGGTLNTDLRGLASLGLDDARLDDSPNRASDLAARTPLNVALSGEDHAWSYRVLGLRPVPRDHRRDHPPRRRIPAWAHRNRHRSDRRAGTAARVGSPGLPGRGGPWSGRRHPRPSEPPSRRRPSAHPVPQRHRYRGGIHPI